MDNSLAAFASQNLRGRALFLSVPVAIAATAHAIVFALSSVPEAGILAGCIAAAAAAAIASWRWLDEPAAVAIEKPYERGALVAASAGIPVLALAPSVGLAFMAAGLGAFGAMCGIARISSSSDLPSQSAGARRLAWLGWLVQTAGFACCLAAPTTSAAAVALVVAWIAVWLAATRRGPVTALG
jgi:hypothetical protein